MRYLLFTTTTCRKCQEFKEFVKSLPCTGRTVDENGTNFKSLLKKYTIITAPTLIVCDRDGEIFRASDLSEIPDEFIKKQ